MVKRDRRQIKSQWGRKKMTGYVGCHGSQEKTLAPESSRKPCCAWCLWKVECHGDRKDGSLKMRAISNSDGINLHVGAWTGASSHWIEERLKIWIRCQPELVALYVLVQTGHQQDSTKPDNHVIFALGDHLVYYSNLSHSALHSTSVHHGLRGYWVKEFVSGAICPFFREWRWV